MLFFRLFLSDIIQHLIYEERSVIGTFQHAFRLCFPVHTGEEFGLFVAGGRYLVYRCAEEAAAPALAGRGEGAVIWPGALGGADGNDVVHCCPPNASSSCALAFFVSSMISGNLLDFA